MSSDPRFPEDAFVEILPRGGTSVNVTTDIDSFSQSGFEREVETKTYFHNAKVTIRKSQADGELKVHVKVTRAIWDEMFWGGTGSDFTSGGDQTPYRVTFCVTTDPSVTVASGALNSGYDHYRKSYADCYVTTFEPTLEVDGMLEGDIAFNVKATDATGLGNIRNQFGSGTEAFAALGSYTTTQKWD